MLSIERVKELLGDQKISDKEAKEIRDDFRALAEIIFEQWKEKRLKDNRPGNPLNKSKKIR
jgi:signal-transduction protein with cAMP-binding, CBS, and nucleotidyltransferase domain